MNGIMVLFKDKGWNMLRGGRVIGVTEKVVYKEGLSVAVWVFSLLFFLYTTSSSGLEAQNTAILLLF